MSAARPHSWRAAQHKSQSESSHLHKPILKDRLIDLSADYWPNTDCTEADKTGQDINKSLQSGCRKSKSKGRVESGTVLVVAEKPNPYFARSSVRKWNWSWLCGLRLTLGWWCHSIKVGADFSFFGRKESDSARELMERWVCWWERMDILNASFLAEYSYIEKWTNFNLLSTLFLSSQ